MINVDFSCTCYHVKIDMPYNDNTFECYVQAESEVSALMTINEKYPETIFYPVIFVEKKCI